MTLLRSHPLLSIWYHNRADPYSSQLRLGVLLATLLISMAVNASMFAGRLDLNDGGDASASATTAAPSTDPISTLSLTLYSSCIMLLVSTALSKLFIRAGVHASARGTNWWMWFAMAVLFSSSAVAIAACLMYAMRFDMGARASEAREVRWRRESR